MEEKYIWSLSTSLKSLMALGIKTFRRSDSSRLPYGETSLLELMGFCPSHLRMLAHPRVIYLHQLSLNGWEFTFHEFYSNLFLHRWRHLSSFLPLLHSLPKTILDVSTNLSVSSDLLRSSDKRGALIATTTTFLPIIRKSPFTVIFCFNWTAFHRFCLFLGHSREINVVKEACCIATRAYYIEVGEPAVMTKTQGVPQNRSWSYEVACGCNPRYPIVINSQWPWIWNSNLWYLS